MQTTILFLTVQSLFCLLLGLPHLVTTRRENQLSSLQRVYLCDSFAVFQVAFQNSGTNSQKKVLDLPTDATCPIWSPDGKYGLVTVGQIRPNNGITIPQALYWFDIRSYKLKLLPVADLSLIEAAPKFVPGQSLQLAVAIGSVLYLYDEYGRYRQLAQAPDIICWLQVSPSGQWISVAYGLDSCGDGARFGKPVEIIHVKTGKSISIPTSPSEYRLENFTSRWRTKSDVMTYVALETKTKRLLLSEFNPATLQNRIIVDSSILTDSLSSTFIAIDPYLLTRSDGTAGVVNTSGEIKSIESIPVLGVGCRRTFAPHLAGLTVPLLAWVDQCPAQSFVGWFDIGTNTPTLVQTVSSGPILNSISRDQQWIIFFSRNGQGYHANALHRRSRHFIDLGSFVPSHLAWSN